MIGVGANAPMAMSGRVDAVSSSSLAAAAKATTV
jgi:hypothetical protein